MMRNAAMGICFVLAAAGACRAQPAAQQATPQPVDGRDIGVTIRVNPHPALGKPFVDRIHQRTAEVLTILLGGSANVVREDTPNLGEWLEHRRLPELTADLALRFGLDRHQRELLIDLRYEQGEYRVDAVEYDRVLGILGTVRSGRSPQRTMVADLVAQLGLRCWSPVGTILRGQGDEFEIEFPELQRLASIPDWSGIRPGTVLQLFLEVRNRDQPREIIGREDQFLIVKSVGPRTLTARPAIPEPAGSTWFRQLGNPRARYLARRTAGATGSMNIRVVLQESDVPQEGCFVYLSPTPPGSPEQLGEMLGATTAAGRLETDFTPDGLRYLSVSYEDLTATRIVVPGVTPTPVRFSFASRGTQTACRLRVDRMKNELSDGSSLLNVRLKEVEAADKALDVDKAEAAAIEAESLKTSLMALRDRAAALRQTPQDCDPAAIKELDELVTATDRLLTEYQGVGDSVKVVRIKVMQREIDVAWKEHRWADVRSRLGEYVTLKREIGQPDRKEEERLNELNAALSVSEPAHLNARTALERSVGIDDIDDLQRRWPEIREALNLLVARRDHFWLRTIYGEFPTWSALLTDERKRQDALRQSQTLSLEQKQELLESMKGTEQTTEEFRTSVGAAATVIQEADRAYQR